MTSSTSLTASPNASAGASRTPFVDVDYTREATSHKRLKQPRRRGWCFARRAPTPRPTASPCPGGRSRPAATTTRSACAATRGVRHLATRRSAMRSRCSSRAGCSPTCGWPVSATASPALCERSRFSCRDATSRPACWSTAERLCGVALASLWVVLRVEWAELVWRDGCRGGEREGEPVVERGRVPFPVPSVDGEPVTAAAHPAERQGGGESACEVVDPLRDADQVSEEAVEPWVGGSGCVDDGGVARWVVLGAAHRPFEPSNCVALGVVEPPGQRRGRQDGVR